MLVKKWIEDTDKKHKGGDEYEFAQQVAEGQIRHADKKSREQKKRQQPGYFILVERYNVDDKQ